MYTHTHIYSIRVQSTYSLYTERCRLSAKPTKLDILAGLGALWLAFTNHVSSFRGRSAALRDVRPGPLQGLIVSIPLLKS